MAAGISDVVAFGGGVASFLSPCVLPVVPGYLSMITGLDLAAAPRPAGAVVAGAVAGGAAGPVAAGAAGAVAGGAAGPVAAGGVGPVSGGAAGAVAGRGARLEGTPRLWRIARETGLFVVGFGIVFVLLGLATTAAGDALLRNKHLLTEISGCVVLAMAAFLAGSLVLQLPWLYREARWHPRLSKLSRLGPFAAPVAGAAFGFGWTPCLTPVLSAVLATAASGRSLAQATGLLVAYTLGLGVPFLAVGCAFGSLAGALGVLRRHAREVTLASAVVLAGLGVLLVLDRLTWLSSEFQSFAAVGLPH